MLHYVTCAKLVAYQATVRHLVSIHSVLTSTINQLTNVPYDRARSRSSTSRLSIFRRVRKSLMLLSKAGQPLGSSNIAEKRDSAGEPARNVRVLWISSSQL